MLVRSLILFALFVPFIAAAAEDEFPPIDVSVFYSKEDPNWAQSEKTIDAVQKRQPRIKVIKVSIDTPEGYKQLAELEKSLPIREPGELTLVMGPLHLMSKGARRDVENYFESMVRRVLTNDAGKGRLDVDVKPFAFEHFGKDAKLEEFNPDPQAHIASYTVLKDGKSAGYVVDAYRHIACPLCNDVQFLMAVGLPDLKILDVRPSRAMERYGAHLSEAEVAKYTGQYKGKLAKETVAVDGVSRATSTSRTYEATVNEILQQLKKREGK